MPLITNRFKKYGKQLVPNKKSLFTQRVKRDSIKLINLINRKTYTFLDFGFGSGAIFAFFTKGSATANHAAGPPAT
jgi:hypothetical protein